MNLKTLFKNRDRITRPGERGMNGAKFFNTPLVAQAPFSWVFTSQAHLFSRVKGGVIVYLTYLKDSCRFPSTKV